MVKALAPLEVRVDKNDPENRVESHADSARAEDGDHPGKEDPLEHADVHLWIKNLNLNLEEADVHRLDPAAKGAAVHPPPGNARPYQGHHLKHYVNIQRSIQNGV